MSPTVVRVGPYRLFFFSNEGFASPHIHVQRERNLAKFWLEPEVRLGASTGFGAQEIRDIERIVQERRETLISAWKEYFGG